MKKVLRATIFACIAFSGIALSSSFVNPDESGGGNSMRQYDGTCPNGKVIKVCGANGDGCTPSGEC